MLEGEGYELIVATNGDDAATLARERSGSIDLLLTDVVMPRMDGFASVPTQRPVSFFSQATPKNQARSAPV
jgi:CheY-like chemotaxis protein